MGLYYLMLFCCLCFFLLCLYVTKEIEIIKNEIINLYDILLFGGNDNE